MYAHYGLLAVAILAIGLGTFMFVKPNVMWKIRRWHNRASGIETSERASAWETSNRISAIVIVVVGIGASVGFWQFAQIVAEEEARLERARDLPSPSFEIDLGKRL